VINRGGASSADVVRFAGRVRDAVADRFGIGLDSEPAFLGFDDAVRTRFGARNA
jgi:UDP-N-acetylenolpyruvoylglucosamine reductase